MTYASGYVEFYRYVWSACPHLGKDYSRVLLIRVVALVDL